MKGLLVPFLCRRSDVAGMWLIAGTHAPAADRKRESADGTSCFSTAAHSERTSSRADERRGIFRDRVPLAAA